MDYSSLKKLPKVELHLHLDCSVSFEVANTINSTLNYETFKTSCIAPERCDDLADYIEKALVQIGLMQTTDNLRLITLDLFRQLSEDHVVYAEIRFAPFEHTQHGLSVEKVVETVSEAMDEAKKLYGIESGLLLCTLRHYDERQSLNVAKLAAKYQHQSRVVGFDIAADEAKYSIDAHKKAFSYAFDQGLSITAHAGEAKGASSVWETLKYFKPTRIGHGIHSLDDPKLVEYLVEHQIHLEVCPTSNVQTKTVTSYEMHPINTLRNHKISVGVNTDGRTISNISLTEEYNKLTRIHSLDVADFKKMNIESLAYAFTTDEIKQKLLKQYFSQ